MIMRPEGSANRKGVGATALGGAVGGGIVGGPVGALAGAVAGSTRRVARSSFSRYAISFINRKRCTDAGNRFR